MRKKKQDITLKKKDGDDVDSLCLIDYVLIEIHDRYVNVIQGPDEILVDNVR